MTIKKWLLFVPSYRQLVGNEMKARFGDEWATITKASMIAKHWPKWSDGKIMPKGLILYLAPIASNRR